MALSVLVPGDPLAVARRRATHEDGFRRGWLSLPFACAGSCGALAIALAMPDAKSLAGATGRLATANIVGSLTVEPLFLTMFAGWTLAAAHLADRARWILWILARKDA